MTQPTDPRFLITAKWREARLTSFDTWNDLPQPMPSGRRRSAGRLLRADMGLAQVARADGDLRPAGGDFYNVKQLAVFMGMSKPTAIDHLAWLEQDGLMSVVKGKPTSMGLGVDERRLVLPTVKDPISAFDQGSVKDPISMLDQGSDGATVKESGSHGKSPLLSHGQRVDLNGLRHPVFPGFHVSRSTEEEVLAVVTGWDESSGILDIAVIDDDGRAGTNDDDDPAPVTVPAIVIVPTPPKDVHGGAPAKFRISNRVRLPADDAGTVMAMYGGRIIVKRDSDGDQVPYRPDELELIVPVEALV